MFNKSECEVALECAILNDKLRLHKGGCLNGLERNRRVLATIRPRYVTQSNYFKVIIGLISLVVSFVLIRKLFQNGLKDYPISK